MKKVIVFDIDRTIIDSYQIELSSLKEAIELATAKVVSQDDLKAISSLSTDKFFESMNFNKEEVSLINKEWDKTIAKYKTTCFPGIKEVIKKLFDNGYILGIITSRTKDEMKSLERELNDISYYFKAVVTSDLVEHEKPNRESMDYLCNILNCDSSDVIYIGDSKKDKDFALNSNSLFIPACWENTELINEDNSCKTINDLINTIETFK